MSLDIFNLNYEFCSEEFDNLSNNKEALPKSGILIRILSLLKSILKLTYNKLTIKQNKCIHSQSTLFFCISKNEYVSIEQIAKKSENFYILGNNSYKNDFPFLKIYLFSLFFIPIVFFRCIFIKDAYLKKSVKYAFDGFCLAYSMNYLLKFYLKEINPKKIVITNHLNVFHRSLTLVANKLKIKTIYIQHASVTNYFPPISEFDYAILDGADSHDKYASRNIGKCKVFLCGVSKFDVFFNHIKKSKIVNISNVGICINGMDDFTQISDLILKLQSKLSPNIILTIRPHPAYRQNSDFVLYSNIYDNILYSDSKIEPSFNYIIKQDLIICGDSNIALEATIMNVPCIYYDPFSLKKDWYGFLKNKVVYYARNTFEVIDLFKLISDIINPDFRIKAKYYVDTINTIHDGNSSNFIFSILNDHCL